MRRRIIEGILATDMKKHQKVIGKIKNRAEVYNIKNGKNFNKMFNETDANKLFDAQQEVLNMLIHEFNKKYSQNSSIGSILCCLYSYQNLTQFYLDEKNQNYINDNYTSKPICFAYLFGVNTINNQVNDDWNNCLCNIRTVLMNENDRFDGNKEIDPGQILPFLLGKLHQELNQCKPNYDSFCPLFTDKNNFNQQNHVDFSNKNQAFNYFQNDFNKNNKSVISDYFFGVMKTKNACGECKLVTYTFNYYYFISFNLDLLPAKYANRPLNILDCIDIQNSICITIECNNNYNCRKCKKITKHYQRRQFYKYPKYLVINLERGYDCHNKIRVSYSLDLNLTNRSDVPNSQNIYKKY
jgi:ubiquitin C-terminal hydrolase